MDAKILLAAAVAATVAVAAYLFLGPTENEPQRTVAPHTEPAPK